MVDNRYEEKLQRVISLITRLPERRSKAEIDILLPWLKQRSDILKNLENDILVTLMKFSAYEKVYRDHVIIRQGDKGECFYIMLTGKTSVYIDTIKSDEEHPPEKADTPTTTQTDTEEVIEQLNEELRVNREGNSTPVISRKQVERGRLGKFIITFATMPDHKHPLTSTSSVSSDDEDDYSYDETDAGKSFGELALLSDDAVRNASIIADDDTDLLVIDRKLFNGTLKSKQESEYQERRIFVKKCSLFRSWSSKFRQLCEMSLRKETLPFDSVLIKQGDPVIGLHFIIKGQGKVSIDPALHTTQYPKLFDGSASVMSKELGMKFMKREQKDKDNCLREQIRVRRRQGYAAAERRLAMKTVTLCYVDESEILGDAELILGLDTYAQTITCTANTEVLILDNKNIERLIYRKNPHTMEMLKQIVAGKIQSRACMTVASQIPLYTHLQDKVQDMFPKRPISAKVKSEEDDKSKSIMDVAMDKDVMVTQLTKLFLNDRAPFIEPSVPGSLYYLSKSSERAQKRRAQSAPGPRKPRAGGTGEVRLQRARRAARRHPRSRRELERLTLGSESKDLKQLENNDHAVNRYLSASQSVAVNSRPVSAMGDMTEVPPTFFMTETKGPEFTETEGDQVHVGYQDIQRDDMKQVVLEMGERQQATNASRAKIICSMIERKASAQPSPVQTISGSKPGTSNMYMYDDDDEQEEEEDSFDWETSNGALKGLEDKLEQFYSKYDRSGNGQKINGNVTELKRFTIQGPEDVPIPGGTVFIRQRSCQYGGGISNSSQHHQHVRRFIIPKDAYRVAVRSLSAIETDRGRNNGKGPSSGRTISSRSPSVISKRTSTVPKGGVDTRRASRIQSAPTRTTVRS